LMLSSVQNLKSKEKLYSFNWEKLASILDLEFASSTINSSAASK